MDCFWVFIIICVLIYYVVRWIDYFNNQREHNFTQWSSRILCDNEASPQYDEVDQIRIGQLHIADRQGNIFTISDETSANRTAPYADFFYLEPSPEEAARIRAQLEKDDKDLPSYEEVMRMTNVTTPTAAPGGPATYIGGSSDTIATTDTIVTVPPYAEIDPNTPSSVAATSENATAYSNNVTLTANNNNNNGLPSTSRAAVVAQTVPHNV